MSSDEPRTIRLNTQMADGYTPPSTSLNTLNTESVQDLLWRLLDEFEGVSMEACFAEHFADLAHCEDDNCQLRWGLIGEVRAVLR